MEVLWFSLLGILIIIQSVATRLADTVSIRVGHRLKRRLLDGVFNLSPDTVRHAGIGTYLGIVFEAETLQTVTFSGGYGGMLGVFELGSTALILIVSGFSQILVPLVGWCVLTAFLAQRYRARFVVWTRERLATTSELAERLIGHRTRLVQSPSLAVEDATHRQRLAQYQQRSLRLDRLAAVLSSLVPQGWLALGATMVFLDARSSSTTSLAAALGAVLLGWQAFSRLSGSVTQITQAWGAWRQLQPLLSSARTKTTSNAQSTEAPHVSDKDGNWVLEARSLAFRHQGRQVNALNGVNVSLAPQGRIIVEGPSGSGKSTLLALLARVRELSDGSLTAVGMDAKVAPPLQWRRHIVLVPQAHENHLFGASMAFNLLMGKSWPPKKQDLQEIFAVLNGLGLQDLLFSMPSGPGQILGETGWQLSQGERSRLWMARAVLQQPEVLLIDEGLGTLDPELRLSVIAYLERFPGAVMVASHE